MRMPAPGDDKTAAGTGGAERLARGFSLAETLFAMAIVAFTLLSIIGLLPSSLAELNEAEQRTAEARILQSLTAIYELKPWEEVKNLSTRELYYFDSRGVQLRGMSDETHYSAQVDQGRSSTGSQEQPGEVTLPGEGSAGEYLRRLRVSITDKPRDPLAFSSNQKLRNHRQYALILANREPDQAAP